MVSPLGVINKVVNKARGITNPPPRINQLSNVRQTTRIVANSKPLTKRTDPDDISAAYESYTGLDGGAGMDRAYGVVPDIPLRSDTPIPKWKGKTQGSDPGQDVAAVRDFMKRPDTPELKDVNRGPPSGKQVDYWALGQTRPGSNKTPANDYHDFLMGRPPQKTVSDKVLKGTMKEKIKSMKKYPGVYKKLKKAYPGLSDSQLVNKMDEFMDKTQEVKSVTREPPNITFPDSDVISYWKTDKSNLKNTPKVKSNPIVSWADFKTKRQNFGLPINSNRKFVTLSGKQQKKLRSQRNIKENEFSAKNIVADIFDGSFFMGKDKAEFKRLLG